MPAVFPQPGAITPGEYPGALLRYIGSLNAPQNPLAAQMGSAPYVTQIAAPEVAEAAAKGPGFFAQTKGVGSALKGIKNATSMEEALAAAKGIPGPAVAGAGLLAAQLAAPHIGNFAGTETNNPEFGNLTESVIKGAALGAGVGSFVPVIGTGLGAAGGGAVAALAHLFGSGHHHKDPNQAIADQEQQMFGQLAGMGLDPQTLAGVRGQYDQLKATSPQAAMSYISKVAESQQANGTPFAGMPGIIDQTTGMDPKQMLALQEQTTKLMAPYMANLQTEANAGIDAWAQLATPEGQHISQATKNLADVYKGSLGELNNAYILQAQGQPFLNAIASSQYNRGVQAQAQGSSGGSSLADVLAGAASSSQASPTLGG